MKANNSISDIFNDFTINQKMSVFNLLLTIGVCDADQGNQDKELKYLNSYIDILNVRFDRCREYLEFNGHERIITDLNLLSQSQKEYLVLIAWEMITCDGKPNKTELHVAIAIFQQIGISEDQFVTIFEKTQALTKHFYRKTNKPKPFQALFFLVITIFVLFLVGSLFSWSVSMYHWNWVSKIIFGAPTIVLGVWTINDYFINPNK